MTRHQTISLPDGTTIISATCVDCNQAKQFTVPSASYDAWANGAHIQDAMPEVPEGERELLISGICGTCFDALFADDDEDDEQDHGPQTLADVGMCEEDFR
ncbi:MAG: hypothetical protein JWN34_1997 [Bryobacterales bacterium]|nr:hypothetical protein [Bryobacterales bacterium]